PRRMRRSDTLRKRLKRKWRNAREPCATNHVPDDELRAGRDRVPSHRKKMMTMIAGMNGPHHVSRPNALSVVDPPFTKSMIAPAHANALMRFSVLNFNDFMPA